MHLAVPSQPPAAVAWHRVPGCNTSTSLMHSTPPAVLSPAAPIMCNSTMVHAGARHAHALRSKARPHAYTCCLLPRQVDVIEASGVTEALAVLGVSDKDSDEKHPEKRMKAAWLAFQERELPALKLEKPGLRINQYKEMLWKTWQKHPDNPIVQAQKQQQGLA
jgi:hypothetical protein